MSEPKKPRPPELDVRTLREVKDFSIIFTSDKGIKCTLQAADRYNLLVISGGQRLLIPKHSIKYVILPADVKSSGPELGAAVSRQAAA